MDAQEGLTRHDWMSPLLSTSDLLLVSWLTVKVRVRVSIVVHSQCLGHANHACHIKRRDNIGMFNGSCERYSCSPIAVFTLVCCCISAMIPTPGGSHDEGGLLVGNLLAEFLRGFSLRTLIFLLDMVLPQLDAYHAGRQLQHLQPWVSVELAQQKKRGQTGTRLQVTINMRRMLIFMSSTYILTVPRSCSLVHLRMFQRFRRVLSVKLGI